LVKEKDSIFLRFWYGSLPKSQKIVNKNKVLWTLVALTIFLKTILLQNQVLWSEKASGKGKLYQNRLKSKIVFKTRK